MAVKKSRVTTDPPKKGGQTRDAQDSKQVNPTVRGGTGGSASTPAPRGGKG